MRVLERDEQVQIIGWGSAERRFTPVFTSGELLQQAVASAGKPMGYVGMSGVDLFRILSQTNVDAVLNPGSAHVRVFTTSEIKRIAEGDFLEPTTQDTSSAGQSVFIGYPREEPTDLVQALRTYFASVPAVEEAYLALMIDKSVGPEPRLLIAVRAEGDPYQIVQDAAVIAREIPTPGTSTPIDFLVLNRPGILGGHFDNRTDPFYRRPSA
jgi:hypothetical protein